jgi:DNA topoisomerase-2
MKNEEIKNMIDILGLKFGVTYNEENIKTLRYGHLMIMADQDSGKLLCNVRIGSKDAL